VIWLPISPLEFTDGSPSKKAFRIAGNVVMLQFTASWCGVCIKEMPHIEMKSAVLSKGLYLLAWIEKK